MHRGDADETPTWAFRRPSCNISVLSYCQELAHQSLCKMQISQWWFQQISCNDRMKLKRNEVCTVKYLRCKGKSGEMQKTTNMHTLRVTLSLGFLTSSEEAGKSRVSVSVNLVHVLPCCSSPNCKVKAFPFTPKIIHILRDYLKDRTDGETSLEGKCSGPGEHRVLGCSSWSLETFLRYNCEMQGRQE